MSINWDLYSTRLKIDGNTFKDRQINSVVNAINGSFKNSPSYYEVSINGSSTLTGIQIVENSSNENNKIDYIRKIIMKPNDTINVGDIVDWDSKKWLVASAESFNGIYWYGMIQECNNTLKFYDNKTTNLLAEVPCIFSDINLNLQEGKIINLPVGHYLVIIPSGYITKEDTNLRFLLNDSAYKIVGISTVTNGLTKIELTDDKITSNDNLELGVADYYSHQSPTPTEDSISISPTDLTIYKGSTKVFTATVTLNGVEDDTAGTVWLLTNKDGTHISYCTMTYDNRTCTLVASNQISYVGKVVVLRIALEDTPDVFIEKEITITSLI